jgi:hypothetical protein
MPEHHLRKRTAEFSALHNLETLLLHELPTFRLG